MPLPGFLASVLIGRSVPVIASVVLHATLAVGLVASAAGHSRAGTSSPVATLEMTVDVDTTETTLAPIEPPLPVPSTPRARAEQEPAPTHTHPYPVDPSHDAHPHDPSLHHDEAVPAPSAHHDHDDDAEKGEPAAAAPALVASGPAALPHFDLASGGGAGGVHVANNGAGNGSGHGAPSAGGSDDVIVPASSVQVAARLVHSVTAAYPVHARADELEGDVAVELVVDREGRVIEARVTRPAGHGFDDAALAAVRAYRVSPAQREGRAVRVRMPWSVQFRLR